MPSRVGLEHPDLLGKLRSGGDEVQVVLDDHVREHPEPLPLVESAPRVVDDLEPLGPREYGQPANDRASEAVRMIRFVDAVAVSGHHGLSPCRVPSGDEDAKRPPVRSHAKRGNDEIDSRPIGGSGGCVG